MRLTHLGVEIGLACVVTGTVTYLCHDAVSAVVRTVRWLRRWLP